MKLNTKQIISLILAALAIVFIIQNFAIVEVKVLIWSITLSRALLILLSLLLGMVIGWLLHGSRKKHKA